MRKVPDEKVQEKLKVFAVDVNTARAMCYVPVFGIIAALLFLIMEKNSQLRWDAVQTIILWSLVLAAVFLLSASRVLTILIPMVNLAGVVVIPLFLIVKAGQKKETRLPFLGEIADRIIK